ncbi:MAG TPA: hypothetical protein VKP88_00415 [Candidatus Paceibacterota bacterium]|jgi:hypothetical protein|nr:hypothetical protein [Candidatus Paceibacterota bacterium]
MASDTGLNQTAATTAVNAIISGGADVRLLNTAVSYDDVAADIDTKEVSATDYSPVNVPEADWNIAYDAANGELTLTNSAVVDFGEVANDYGVVVDVVIQDPTTDEFIRADEVNDPDITAGEQVRFPAGEITYTLGP